MGITSFMIHRNSMHVLGVSADPVIYLTHKRISLIMLDVSRTYSSEIVLNFFLDRFQYAGLLLILLEIGCATSDNPG